MKIRYDPGFYKFYKKANVLIRHAFDKQILIFIRNPIDPILNNHELEREWVGYRSINITADWRAIYKEVETGEEIIAYFVALGTHDELYSKN